MSRSNKAPGALAAWSRLLALLGLVVLAASCTNTTSDIGVGLPDVNTDTGAFLIDTLTVRSSTVLRDSVPSSNSQYLYVGQYTDPVVGKLTARSAFRLALPGGYAPDPTAIFDSITLILRPNAYRYGDTTKTQALVEVRKLTTPISTTKYSYTAPRLTPMGYDSTHVDSLLNFNQKVPRGRARPSLRTLRLRLDRAFGQRLLSMGKAGRLSTQDDLDAYLPGLVITPAAGDEGTIIGLSATDAGAVMNLYYHVPTDPTTVITSVFSLADGGRHFFQIRANRLAPGVAIRSLPRTALAPVSSALTGSQTVIQGALGLQTRLEFPYLTSLRQFGNNLTVTSALLSASVPTATLTPYAPVPPPLSIYYTDAVNHPTGLYQSGIVYTTGISTLTGIDQGIYTWSVIDYCKAVLANTIPNNGLLLASATPDVPSRVVIGDSRSTLNKLTFRVYFIRVQ